MKKKYMTQEEKSLLLKDLCGRLPYTYSSKGIIDCKYSIKGIVSYIGEDMVFTVIGICDDILYLYASEACQIEDFKPYLRPMSSMTEDECKKLGELPATIENISEILPNTPYFIEVVRPEQIDWLNKRMFDYRGLIERGLALEVPNGMYNLDNK